jgi:hypothetical protein
MKLIAASSICRAVALAGVVALISPDLASAGPAVALPSRLVLRAEGQLLKVGTPTKDFFAGIEATNGFCQETALGSLRSNSQPTDSVRFMGAEKITCSEGTRIVSGALKRIELADTGQITEHTSWRLELPGRCRYAITKLQTTVPIPSELLGPELAGVATLQTPVSASGCASVESVTSGMDLSEVEFGSIPYSTELG